MADRIIKGDSGNDVIIQNNAGSRKIEVTNSGDVEVTGDVKTTTVKATNLKANDGTTSLEIADSTGEVTSSGGLKAVNIKATNIKANDGTAGLSVADSTGRITFSENNPLITLGSNTTFPPGTVLQVVQSTKVDTDSHASLTFGNISGTDQAGSGSIFCVKITPRKASSKILFTANLMVGGKDGNAGPKIKLLRDSTSIAIGDNGSNNNVDEATFGNHFSTTDLDCRQMSVTVLDSPSYSLNDEITYKPQIRSESGSHSTTINKAFLDNNAQTSGLRLFSNLIVMEIAG